MSHPRMSVASGTYLSARTTVMSMFLLVPNKVVNEIMTRKRNKHPLVMLAEPCRVG